MTNPAIVEAIRALLVKAQHKAPTHGVPEWDWLLGELQQLASASALPQPIPADWADAANSARGLCESEANKWETTSPQTAAHWQSVATRLGALYLTQDHLAASALPQDGEQTPTCEEGLRALAFAMRKVLPPTLLAEVIAHLDPLTPFMSFLATFKDEAAPPRTPPSASKPPIPGETDA